VNVTTEFDFLEEVQLHESGHCRGAVFPDYELTDHTGKHRKLSDLQGPDPMILVLSRGGYCPKDRRQAEGLVQLHHEMEVGYSRLVTISTDNMLLTNEYRTGAGAHWTLLSDPGRKVQKDLDIAEYTDLSTIP
jgi:peroxiredoxin